MEQRNQNLLKIFESEANEKWYSAFSGYNEISKLPCAKEVAIHYAFFCWYMLWQWDEMIFPGEKLSFSERISVDVRGGISKSELSADLNTMTHQLLASGKDIPDKYLAIIVHMKRIYPYFFKSDILSDEKAEQLLVQLEDKCYGDLATSIICAYQRNSDIRCKTELEKNAIKAFFPMGSLINGYFQWLLIG